MSKMFLHKINLNSYLHFELRLSICPVLLLEYRKLHLVFSLFVLEMQNYYRKKAETERKQDKKRELDHRKVNN